MTELYIRRCWVQPWTLACMVNTTLTQDTVVSRLRREGYQVALVRKPEPVTS